MQTGRLTAETFGKSQIFILYQTEIKGKSLQHPYLEESQAVVIVEIFSTLVINMQLFTY